MANFSPSLVHVCTNDHILVIRMYLHSHLTQYCLLRLVCYKDVHYSLLNVSCWIRSHTKQRLHVTTGGLGCPARCTHTVHPPVHPSRQPCALQMITHFTAEETEAQPKVIKLASAEPGLHSFSKYFFLKPFSFWLCCIFIAAWAFP